MNHLRQWMMRLVALGMILLLQGPAMITQEIAWFRMFIDYSKDSGITQGVIDTFGCQRPCDLCELAEQLRNESHGDPAGERRDQRQRPAWADMLPTTARPGDCFRERIVRQTPVRPRPFHASSRGEHPPVPPPRSKNNRSAGKMPINI